MCWYNILANPNYAAAFNFIEVNVPDRGELIVDGDEDEANDCEQSDLVQVLLNIAFAPRTVVQEFEFGPGISKKFKNTIMTHKEIDWSMMPNRFKDKATLGIHTPRFTRDKGIPLMTDYQRVTYVGSEIGLKSFKTFI